MDIRKTLKNDLLKLNKRELKLFYGMIVYYWGNCKSFISKQNFFDLWCELNYLCYEIDESFPEPYDDHELIKSFCHEHPYYFIDILCPEMIIDLFCQYLDDRLDVLAMIANKLHTEGLRATYEYSNEAMGMSDDIETLVSDVENHVKMFS